MSVSSCRTPKIDMEIAQGAAETLVFTDVATADYSGCTEITFDVWNKAPGIGGATNLLSVSLTGAEIVLPTENQFQFNVDNDTSAALPAGVHYCEAWVTLSGGERRLVGAGRFIVIDTRKHDA